jgi:ABC-type transport system involved in multi-copper enzyme maturation permease subunit
VSAVWVLALDVLQVTAQRRLLWIYLVLGALPVLVVVPGLAVQVHRDRSVSLPDARDVPLTLAGGARDLIPGSVAVTCSDLTLRDDGRGGLWATPPVRDPREEGPVSDPVRWGTVDYAQGLVRLERRLPAVAESAVVSCDVPFEGWSGDTSDEGDLPVLLLFGTEVNRARPSHLDRAGPVLVAIFLHLALVWALASVVGVILGLLAVHDAALSPFRPGAAELLLSRPVSRGQVVVGRLGGGVLFALLLSVWVCGLAVVLTRALHGVWVLQLLAVIPALVLKFTLLLGIVTAVGLWLRSGVLALGAGAVAWLASLAVSLSREWVLERGLVSYEVTTRWLQVIVPPIIPTDHLGQHLAGIEVSVPASFDPREVALQSLAWLALTLVVSLLLVRRRDC